MPGVFDDRVKSQKCGKFKKKSIGNFRKIGVPIVGEVPNREVMKLFTRKSRERL